MELLSRSNPRYSRWVPYYFPIPIPYRNERVYLNGKPYYTSDASISLVVIEAPEESVCPLHADLFFSDQRGGSFTDGRRQFNSVDHLKIEGKILSSSPVPKVLTRYQNILSQSLYAEPIYILNGVPFGKRVFSFDGGITYTISCQIIDSYLGCPVYAIINEYIVPNTNRCGAYCSVFLLDTASGSVSDSGLSSAVYRKQSEDFIRSLDMAHEGRQAWYSWIVDHDPEFQPLSFTELSPTSVVLKAQSSDWTRYFPDVANQRFNWNALAGDAYSELGFFDGNGIAYITDVVSMGRQVQSTLQSLRKLAKGKAKIAASLFLSFHYGYSLFIKDTKDLYDALGKMNSLSRCQASSSIVTSQNTTVDYRYQCWYHPWEQVRTELARLIRASDLALDFSNAWDMIPFSFVLDWFVNVGDTLQALDNYLALIQTHRVVCSSQSLKAQRKLSLQQVASGGIIIDPPVVSYYQRRYFSRPLGPEFHLSPSNPLTALSNHWIEAGALCVSKR